MEVTGGDVYRRDLENTTYIHINIYTSRDKYAYVNMICYESDGSSIGGVQRALYV